MQKLVWQNANGDEVNLTGGNYGITAWEGFSNTSLNIQSQQVPFQDGGVFLDALLEQRELSVTLAIYDGNNLETRYRLRRELIHILNPKLGEGYLIYTNDFTSKRIKCVPQIPLFETHNSNDSGTPKASLAWTACEPYWEDLEEKSVSILGSQTIKNEGDTESAVKIFIPPTTEGFEIINKTNEKKIILSQTQNGSVEIDTNNGHKSVKVNDISFTLTQGGNFKKIVFGNGVYVYIGSQLLVEDILTTKKKVVEYSEITDVIFVNGYFYFLKERTKLYKSVNGIDMELIYTFTAPCEGIFYLNNFFIVLGNYGNTYSYAISTDGYTWSNTKYFDERFHSYYKLSITYGNGVYIVVGDSWIYVSTDLENWVAKGVSEEYTSVCYGKEKFIACTNIGSFAISTDNGDTWTYYDSTRIGTKIYFINDVFISLATTSVFCSSDGENYINVFHIGGNNISGTLFSDIIYANNMFTTVGKYGVITEGNSLENLKLRENLITLSSILSVVYGKGFFLVNGVDISNYPVFLKSYDGFLWHITPQGTYLRKIVFCNNNFFAINVNHELVKSEDGLLWGEPLLSNTFVTLCVAFGKGIYIAGGINNSSLLFRSYDGENWSEINLGENYSILNCIFANELFIAVGSNGVILRSENGIDWEDVSTEVTVSLDITYGKGMFVAVGHASNKTYILKSNNGRNWTITETSILFSKIIFANNIFIGYGSSGFFYESPNCIDWILLKKDFYCSGNVLMSYSKKDDLYVGIDTTETSIFVSKKTNGQNLISTLTNDSDMTFNLEVGDNEINCINQSNIPVEITFRQKYLGV